jgi:phage terminase large subunit
MTSVKVEASRVFLENKNACEELREDGELKNKIIFNRGGTRSTKTVSIAQLHICIMISEQNIVMDVVRGTLPALKATVLKDIIYWFRDFGVWDNVKWNKTEGVFYYGTNELSYYSVDDDQKVRGRARDYLWLNEANEIRSSEFDQMAVRTRKNIFIDFNPSDEFSWLNVELEKQRASIKKDVKVIVSTYKDNPFLSKSQIEEIEYRKKTNPSWWRVFGKGEYGKLTGLIYDSKPIVVDEFPIDAVDIAYGLDFGYSVSKTALIKGGYYDGHWYRQELIYETGLQNKDIIERLHELDCNDGVIWADSSEPKSIQDIRDAGFSVEGVEKGADSVKNGINQVREFECVIVAPSENYLKERRGYVWELDKNGKPTNKPAKGNDHLMDAERYFFAGNVARPEFVGIGKVFN